MNKNYKLLSVGLALSMYGCATNEKMTSLNPEIKSELSSFKSRIESKKKNGEYLLSPNNFEKSQKMYSKAMSAAKSGATLAEVNKYVKDGMSSLDKLERNVSLSKVHIQNVVDAREEAFNEGAYSLSKFKNAEDELRELAEDIEEKDINSAIENKNKVVKMFNEAEIEAIQNRELALVESNIKKIDKLDGDDYFDKELESLKKNIKTSKVLIERHKDTPEKYMPSITKTTEMSQRILALSKTANWLDKNSKRSVALTLEKDLDTISKPMSRRSLDDLSYDSKVVYLKRQASFVPVLRSELTKTQLANLDKKMKLNDLEKTNESLTAKVKTNKEFRDKISSIRKNFGPDEAEVLMQGDKLIIRLVGLNFSVGKSKIPSNSKSLLDRVANSIKDLNSKDIEIQGHTDSTGNALFNERLSKDRAEAVSKYLTSKDSFKNVNTDIVGYGFRKPVSQNKSVLGRVQNRRVDIVIDSLEKYSE